jgi:hypothetical protein
MGTERKYFTQFSLPANFKVGSGLCPTDIVITSRTVRAANAGLTVSVTHFGRRKSPCQKFQFALSNGKTTAVDVKLLLVEYIVCLRSGRYGFHQASQ